MGGSSSGSIPCGPTNYESRSSIGRVLTSVGRMRVQLPSALSRMPTWPNRQRYLAQIQEVVSSNLTVGTILAP